MDAMTQIDLVVPMPPTPDADLHLGHAAGPYISADIFQRVLRLLGRRVWFVSGCDAFENWCAEMGGQALSRMRQRHETALTSLGVEFDSFLSPLEGAFEGIYRKTLQETFRALKVAPQYETDKEEVLCAVDNGTHGFGVNVLGSCPHCQAPVQGSSCIQCFNYIQPSELVAPRMPGKFGATPVEVTNAFFRIDGSTDEELARVGLSPAARQRFAAWCQETKGRMRLTYQGDFGVQADAQSDCVLRNAYLHYCLAVANFVVGEANAATTTYRLHAFMGIDNFIPNGVGTLELSKHFPSMHVARVELNHMMHYAGQKFSKSKHHGPKILEVARNWDELTMATLRVHLAGIGLRDSICDFDLDAFQSFDATYRRAVRNLADAVRKEDLASAEDESRIRQSAWWPVLQYAEANFDRVGLTRQYEDMVRGAEAGGMGVVEPLIGMQFMDPVGYGRLKARIVPS